MNFDFIKTAKYGFILMAVIWGILVTISLIRLQQDSNIPMISALVIAVLMFGNTAALLFCAWGITTGKHWLYIVAITVLVINILLSITDQVGFLDLFTMFLDIGLLLLLVIKRSVFISQK